MIKLNENTASKVVFQVQDSNDAQWFAGLLGTKTIEKETSQREQGLFFDRDTGMKSIREVEEYIVHPNTLKNLRTGEVLIVCSKVDPHHGVVKTYLANEYRAGYVRANKTIRSSQVRRTLNTRITPRRNERESLSPKDFI
jgi:type IV secretory pathway TraG/TraD family ATPase VirD4